MKLTDEWLRVHGNLTESAKEVAQFAHTFQGQKRKYSGEPYHVHPQEVADLVAKTGARSEVIAAAHLHDVAEDVDFDNIVSALKQVFDFNAINHNIINDLRDKEDQREAKLMLIGFFFGADVMDLVNQVTDVSKLSDGNRKVRKQLDLEHLMKASPEAQTIKLADMASNTASIVVNDPEFAKVYMAEKKAALDYLHDGDQCLWLQASKAVKDWEEGPWNV